MVPIKSTVPPLNCHVSQVQLSVSIVVASEPGGRLWTFTSAAHSLTSPQHVLEMYKLIVYYFTQPKEIHYVKTISSTEVLY